MAKIKIDRERCKGCALCAAACPRELLMLGSEINKQGYLFVTIGDTDKCKGCTFCAQMCPDVAIEVWK
jgi:2-oxoglutarate ferredoxin oxidoreductase subunit delta